MAPGVNKALLTEIRDILDRKDGELQLEPQIFDRIVLSLLFDLQDRLEKVEKVAERSKLNSIVLGFIGVTLVPLIVGLLWSIFTHELVIGVPANIP